MLVVSGGEAITQTRAKERAAELAALFPHPTYDDQRRLTQVSGVSLEEHLHRLDVVRGRLLEAFAEMELVEFRRVRSFPHLDVTPEWVLHATRGATHFDKRSGYIIRLVKCVAPV